MPASSDDTPTGLATRFRAVRQFSEALCEPLEPEDYQLQSMPDASPPKWHLAHTTWFFETFVLGVHSPGHRPFHPRFTYLFNSYYDAVGARHPRFQRGVITRPTVAEVQAYRRHVDGAMLDWLGANPTLTPDQRATVELGLNHEQQHQELLLTDLKHGFAQNPLLPAYKPAPAVAVSDTVPMRWVGFDGGLHDVGHSGEGFVFDNEGPRHRVYLRPFEIASRLVTAGEFREFVDAGGYDKPGLWLSDGFAARQRHGWTSPGYWHPFGATDRQQFTLAGVIDVDPAEPVSHVSFYEAEAYSRWRGVRLATEFEWEVACGRANPDQSAANLQDGGTCHPRPAAGDGLTQMIGDGWEWTASPYSAYPGYHAAAGALGEYNGKFMCNQMVLRGGSCATPRGHVRPTYRNFFPPEARWQFTAIRLARDI